MNTQEFFRRLESDMRYEEAKALVDNEMPPPGAVTRPLFTNLQHFVYNFGIPTGASRSEALQYQRLFELWVSHGAVDIEVIDALRRAIATGVNNPQRLG